MNERGEHSHLGRGLVLFLIAVGLVASGLWWALVTDVTVSLLWPLGATAGMIGLGYLYVETRHTLRLERLEREAADRPVMLPPPTAAEMLQDLRADFRIGDAERDVAVEALRSHYAAGRLDASELDERLAAAMTARTPDDLRPALAGLPDERTGR